jgi:hypothetical protein
MLGLSLQDWAAVATIAVAVVGMVRRPVEARPTPKAGAGSHAVRPLRSARRRVRRTTSETREQIAA